MTNRYDFLKSNVRSINDFPSEGIIFRDITTLLNDSESYHELINIFFERYRDKNIDYVIGADARGFIFGGALAYLLGCGFVPIRKKGKLPHKTITAEYELEYGSAVMEIHEDAVAKNSRVVLIDDLLATGGTACAMAELVNKLGCEIIELAFVIELEALKGKEKLGKYHTFSILKY